jgi:hypothetical protein
MLIKTITKNAGKYNLIGKENTARTENPIKLSDKDNTNNLLSLLGLSKTENIFLMVRKASHIKKK